MNSAETFRILLTERLEAAAQEIFQLFHRSVAQYEGEIERQRRLLALVWKPHIKLQRIGRVHPARALTVPVVTLCFTAAHHHGCNECRWLTESLLIAVSLLESYFFQL